ncbi:MAG TPA: hypothetical protein VFX59_03725 [Polyangiales bacterium]|nr:hypothetical protein [Polyangiales bacterium]
MRFINYVRSLPRDPNSTPPTQPMYAGMTDSDLGAIYDFLRTVKPVKSAVEVASAH